MRSLKLNIFEIIILILILMLIAVVASGCQLQGVSVGGAYLKTDVEVFGQKSEIDEFMPMVLVNFSIGEKNK